MTLPKKAEKEYLELTPAAEGGFTIQGQEEHTAELADLFRQHGVACRLEPDAGPGQDALVFTRQADVGQVQEILDAYKHAKGS